MLPTIFAHTLTVLSGRWSLHAQCSVTGNLDPGKVTVMNVVPAPNNGATELVDLHIDEKTLLARPLPHMHLFPQCKNRQEVLSFEFQKIRCSYNVMEKKRFLLVAFPMGNALSYHQSNRGLKGLRS
ncbi:hypothetical protein CB1_000923002 [Camelus ferus]|nr:hypothetical protein CB1_000923002 [Camelus ferus]